jgi:hypothetical protein
VTITGPVKI